MKKSAKDFFQAISEYPHNIGIYLTYTLDNEVIDKLSEVSTGTILILHDYKQGKTLVENNESSIVCLPIRTLRTNDKNCFHAKLAFLKSEEGAKLIVGSANLSTDSFLNEKEIAIELELKFENPSDVFIYNQILHFFEQLKSQLLVTSNVLEQTLDKFSFTELAQKESEVQFIYTSPNNSIFDELKKYISKYRNGQKAKRIKIATPFVSEEYYKIEEFKSISSDIEIYLRKGAKIKPFQEHNFKFFQPANKKT